MKVNITEIGWIWW